MLSDRIEAKWIDVFAEILGRSQIGKGGEAVAILSETQSRSLNVHLAELAVQRLGGLPFHVVLPTPRNTAPVPVRSTGASLAIGGLAPALAALKAAPAILDLTVEGLMHARETAEILKAGARILTLSNEHPEALERLIPTEDDEARVRAAVKRLKAATRMTVTSAAGSDLAVDMTGAATVGVWGFTAKPGTLQHVPAGLVVSFPRKATTNGRLVFAPGDVNLTFKRYFETPVTATLENDYITRIDGTGTDAELMRRSLAAWGDRNAYAVSHVGFGMNERARLEALTMYDQRDTNGTEIRAVAGNFLFSTGANEFAGRFTAGHFDLPMMGTTIKLDGEAVVENGRLLPVFG
ncbi:MAG: peptidase M29 [Hyphomicrobiaceae bacterium]